MSSHVLDHDDTAETVASILSLTESLTGTETYIVQTVQEIGLLMRRLSIAVVTTDRATVEQWIAVLKNVPESIGVHPELSNQGQRIVDYVRQRATERLDEEWLAEARIHSEQDSGIFLADESGILLRKSPQTAKQS